MLPSTIYGNVSVFTDASYLKPLKLQLQQLTFSHCILAWLQTNSPGVLGQPVFQNVLLILVILAWQGKL